MSVIKIGKESPNSNSWWSDLKSWWKDRKRLKADKSYCEDFIYGIGTPPTEKYFNKDNKYWELFWNDEEDNFLHIKLGSSLAVMTEAGKPINVVWVRFNHEASGRPRMYPWYLESASDIFEFVQNCRQAIDILKYGK